MSMFQDNDDLNIHDDGEDSPVASQGAWPAFSSAPASASLKPGSGLQVSALGQLLGGQNTGNIASMVSTGGPVHSVSSQIIQVSEPPRQTERYNPPPPVSLPHPAMPRGHSLALIVLARPGLQTHNPWMISQMTNTGL